jgi:hypothetical protein
MKRMARFSTGGGDAGGAGGAGGAQKRGAPGADAEAGDAPPAKKPSSGAGDDASKEDGADGE